jgi:hypothetical protein
LDRPWWFWTENNGCAFRKSVWQEIPFDEQIEFAEDRLWCYQVLNAGYRITTAQAWYQYFKTERFWQSVRTHQRRTTALYRLTGQKPPLRSVLQQIFVSAPKQAAKSAVHTGLKIVLLAVVEAMAPRRASRRPRVGSVR